MPQLNRMLLAHFEFNSLRGDFEKPKIICIQLPTKTYSLCNSFHDKRIKFLHASLNLLINIFYEPLKKINHLLWNLDNYYNTYFAFFVSMI